VDCQKEKKEAVILFTDSLVNRRAIVIVSGDMTVRVTVVLASCQLSDAERGTDLALEENIVVRIVVISV
jgi:hypothetical protein